MTLKQTAFRLDEEDFAVLDAVKRRMGFAARADALRFVLRDYGRREGIISESGKRKRRR